MISNPQPNALFAQEALRDMLSRDMALAYRKALDLQVLTAIDDATTNTRSKGTDVLVDAIYKAAQDVADDGFSPSVAVIGSATFTALALQRDGVDQYYVIPFAAGQPLEGITPVVAPEASLTPLSTKIHVVDASVVEVFRSGVAFEANGALLREQPARSSTRRPGRHGRQAGRRHLRAHARLIRQQDGFNGPIGASSIAGRAEPDYVVPHPAGE